MVSLAQNLASGTPLYMHLLAAVPIDGAPDSWTPIAAPGYAPAFCRPANTSGLSGALGASLVFDFDLFDAGIATLISGFGIFTPFGPVAFGPLPPPFQFGHNLSGIVKVRSRVPFLLQSQTE
jgi:hypothetical protein